MLIHPPPIYRKRRGHGRIARKLPVPVGPPVLVSAAYASGQSVTLAFDRAVDVAGMDVERVGVDDGPGTEMLYVGSGPAVAIDARTVRVGLAGFDLSDSNAVTMTAHGDTGIVAADGGQAWAGVGTVVLPYEGALAKAA